MAEDWLADVRKYVADADEGVVAAIVKYCGIALQDRDSSLVAMSDVKERTLVRENYLKKKLGLTHSDADLDSAVLAVGDRMKADRTKNRVTVYYLLAEHFGLLGLFGGVARASAATAGLAAGAAGLAAMAPAAASAAPLRALADDGNNRDDDGGFLGWGCGVAALVLGAIILAALLAWAAMRKTPEPTAATAPVAVAPAPVADAAPAIPEGAGVIAGELAGRPKLTVYFETAKSDVTKDLTNAAAGLKAYVDKNPGAKIAVSGYNDPRGDAAMNAELSKNRAQAVAKALAEVGIPASSIVLEKPAEATDADVSQAEARRVEVVVKP